MLQIWWLTKTKRLVANIGLAQRLIIYNSKSPCRCPNIFLRVTMILNTFQVFSEIAARLVSEGADKTWDQCRIKLKNLKSQYRYVKERIPYIDDLDLDNEEVIKQLLTECQAKAISPSSIKHLKFLLRYGERSHNTVKNDFILLIAKLFSTALNILNFYSGTLRFQLQDTF